MAGGDEFLSLGSDVRKVGAALMFMGAGTNVYDAFSAVMSSPWSTEKFTNDPEEERMAKEYVTHGLVISGLYAALGSWLAKSWWPLVGAAGVAVYMTWLYARAISRSHSAGGMSASVAGSPNLTGMPGGYGRMAA